MKAKVVKSVIMSQGDSELRVAITKHNKEESTVRIETLSGDVVELPEDFWSRGALDKDYERMVGFLHLLGYEITG